MARGGRPDTAHRKRAWIVAGAGAACALAAVSLLPHLQPAPRMEAGPGPGLERNAPAAPSPEAAAPVKPDEAPSRHAEATSLDGPSEMGEASWYDFDGEETASGETMAYEALTAAHPTLPPGTRVMVENVENGQTVVVRINDRGPYADGRIIDVSKAAAERLDMIKDGVATVRVWRVAGPAAHEAVSFF